MRHLIAALERVRAGLLSVVADLEAGDHEKATEQLGEIEAEFRAAMKEIQAA